MATSSSMCQFAGPGQRRVIQGIASPHALNTPANTTYNVFKTTGKQEVSQWHCKAGNISSLSAKYDSIIQRKRVEDIRHFIYEGGGPFVVTLQFSASLPGLQIHSYLTLPETEHSFLLTCLIYSVIHLRKKHSGVSIAPEVHSGNCPHSAPL